MRTPPLLADFTHPRACKPICEKSLTLPSRADREGKCFPSVRTISRDTKLSMSTVRRALDDLVNTGYIQKQPRWRANGAKSSNQYVFRI